MGRSVGHAFLAGTRRAPLAREPPRSAPQRCPTRPSKPPVFTNLPGARGPLSGLSTRSSSVTGAAHAVSRVYISGRPGTILLARAVAALLTYSLVFVTHSSYT